MKERPILFSAAMVKALLAGTKTQTRRLVNAKHEARMFHDDALGYLDICPYGQPGDRLWVRETWAPVDFLEVGHALEEPVAVGYRADLTAISHEKDNVHALDVDGWNWGLVTWRPSIFMPRWASRITLEVTEVRVQQLQEISEEDALAESVTATPYIMADGSIDEAMSIAAVSNYAYLWDSINGQGSWGSNPWVWAISFRVVSSPT